MKYPEISELLSIVKIHQIRSKSVKSRYKAVIGYIITLTPPEDNVAAASFWKRERKVVYHLLDNLNITSG